MIANLNALIDTEKQAKQVIEGFLATGSTEVQEIFQKYHAEKEQILKVAEQQRDALKKQYVELQASVDASYEQFEKSHVELQKLVWTFWKSSRWEMCFIVFFCLFVCRKSNTSAASLSIKKKSSRS